MVVVGGTCSASIPRPFSDPCRSTSATPLVWPPPVGGVRLIWPTIAAVCELLVVGRRRGARARCAVAPTARAATVVLGSRCVPEPPPGLITKITIAAMIAAARTDSSTIPPVRELRGLGAAVQRRPTPRPAAGVVAGPEPGRRGRSGIGGSGLEASGASSVRTTRAHARCSRRVGERVAHRLRRRPPAADRAGSRRSAHGRRRAPSSAGRARRAPPARAPGPRRARSRAFRRSRRSCGPGRARAAERLAGRRPGARVNPCGRRVAGAHRCAAASAGGALLWSARDERSAAMP